MDCKYYIKGDPNERAFTYMGLVTEFQSRGLNNYSDIVYSKGENTLIQDQIYSKLSKLKKEGFVKGNMSYRDGEPVISDNESVSIQEFIDTDNFSQVAKTYRRMSDDDYIAYETEILTSKDVLAEEARKQAIEKVDKWKTIGEDAIPIHTILTSFDTRRSRDDFKDATRDTKLNTQAAYQLYDSLKKFKGKALGDIRDKNGGLSSIVINNVNLKAEIEELDQTLFGHIDMIVIDGNGTLHLYNYKVTTDSMNPQEFKLEKYKYQMALLKQILASHGFKVKDAKLNIVPIKLQYSDDMTEITSAIVNANPTEFTVKDGRYIFSQYDKVAQHFIKASASVDRLTTKAIDEANKELGLIFTTRDVRASGIRLTAREWIRRNRASILDSNNPEYSYVVEFGGGDVAYIKSPTKPENNLEMLRAVEEYGKNHSLLESNLAIDTFLKEVRKGVNKGNSFSGRNYPRTGVWLDTIFSKYFNKKPKKDPKDTKEEKPDWEIIGNDVTDSAGLILLRNRHTYQVDVISLTDLDLSAEANFRRFNYILGDHLNKNQLAQRGLVKYKSTYGNIEAVRAMVLLNKVLPSITGPFTLGKLHIVSLNQTGEGLPFSIEQFNKECFSGVLDYLNDLPETKIQNNFTNCSYVSTFEVLLQEWASVSDDIQVSDSEKQELIETGFGALASATTLDAKISALYKVEQALLDAYPLLRDIDNLSKLKNNRNYKAPARLYELVLKSLQYFTVGELSSVEEKLNDKDKYCYVADRVPNRNYQVIVDQYTKAINAISEQTGNKWASLRKIFEDYYDKVGYSRVQNSTLGGQARVFDDLYLRTKDGKRLLRLLNPYDPYDMGQIKPEHRAMKQQFLKKILYEFAKIKYPMRGIKFDFTSESDPALQTFIERHRDTYFNIPLESASKSTRMQNLSFIDKIKRFGSKIHLLLTNPKAFAKEQLEGELTDDQIKERDASIKAMQIYNPFMTGETKEARARYIAEKGEDFFETNLERLLIHFIESDIQSKEYHKTLVITKAVLLRLDMLGRDMNDQTTIKQTIDMIEKYVKLNVFNMSIMDESSQKILGSLAPLKRLVSDTLIGGNVIGGLRDTFEGVWQNMVRTINKFQTNISYKSLSKAYVTVVKNSFTDGRTINIVNQLCKIYRLSNVDVSRISEGLITERGLTNMRDWLYASLRRPDFLNRMVLFVAQCYEDGVYDAFSIKDGKLTYDWKKDKRFKIYASGDTSNKDYYTQMGAYYNAIRAYNLDHPGADNSDHPRASLSYSDDLPMPYSFEEVESFKGVAKNIYGAYDKSTRAMMDHMALGTVFGAFSTWMNGIYTNWMAKPMVYNSGQLEVKQATNEAGNLQFFDQLGNILIQVKDSEGNVKYYYDGTTEPAQNTEHLQPVIDQVPIMVQGIWYTLKDCGRILKQGIKEDNVKGLFKDYIWADPMQRKNIEKLFSDLLALILFGTIFGAALTPAYKEFKKGMKERDFLTNACVELLYKSSSRSYDGFMGVYNIYQFLGENTNPPIWSQNMKLMKETGSVLLGRRSVTDALNGNVAVFKTFQDSWRAYDKAQEKKE